MTPETLRRLTLALNQQHVVSLNIASCVVEMANLMPREEGNDAFLARTAFNTSLLTLLEQIKTNADRISELENSIKREALDAG